jgi:hypothetical protein
MSLDFNDFIQNGRRDDLRDLILAASRADRFSLNGLSGDDAEVPRTLEPPTVDQVTSALAESSGGSPAMVPTYVSYRDILNKPLEFEPFLTGFFNREDKLIIHAAGGVGKSMFEDQILLYLASSDQFNEPLFGQFQAPKPRTALILQTENSQTALYQRLSARCNGEPRFKAGLERIFILSAGDDVCLYGMDFGDEDSGGFGDFIVQQIRLIEEEQNCKIDLLVFDPFISFAGVDENDNRAVRRVLDLISLACGAADVTPMLIHHDSKGGDFRGATAIHDWCRVRVHLTPEQIGGSNCVKVVCAKSNNLPKFETFYLNLDPETLLFVPYNSDGQPNSKDQRNIDLCREVFRTLKKMGGFADTQELIAREYGRSSGKPFSTAKRHVKLARDKGFIIESWDEKKFRGFELSQIEKTWEW